MNERISWLQFAALLTVSALFAETTNLPAASDYSMGRFISLLFSTGVIFLLYFPLMIFSTKTGQGGALRIIADKNRIIGWVFGTVILLRLLYLAVLSSVQLEFYITNTIMPYFSFAYFIIIIFAAAIYGSHKGIEAIARIAPISLAIFLALIATVTISTWQDISLIRIYSPLADGGISPSWYKDVIKNDEIFFFAIISGFVAGKDNVSGARKSVLLYLPIALLFSEWYTFLYNAVLGNFLEVALYPLYTISSFSDLTLIKRLDGIDVAAGIVAGVIKITLVFICAKAIITDLLGKTKHAQATGKLTSAILAVITAGIVAFFTTRRELLLSNSLDIYLWAALIITAVLLPLTAFIYRLKR